MLLRPALPLGVHVVSRAAQRALQLKPGTISGATDRDPLEFEFSPVSRPLGAQYAVYKGDSKDLLRKNLDDRATAYCGLQNLLLDGRTCEFQMSPFWQTYVGIKDGQGDIRCPMR